MLTCGPINTTQLVVSEWPNGKGLRATATLVGVVGLIRAITIRPYIITGRGREVLDHPRHHAELNEAEVDVFIISSLFRSDKPNKKIRSMMIINNLNQNLETLGD